MRWKCPQRVTKKSVIVFRRSVRQTIKRSVVWRIVIDELNKEIESNAKRLKTYEEQKIALIEASTKEKEELDENISKLKTTEVENNETISGIEDFEPIGESSDRETSPSVGSNKTIGKSVKLMAIMWTPMKR